LHGEIGGLTHPVNKSGIAATFKQKQVSAVFDDETGTLDRVSSGM
jgi:hypothetical protein